MFQNKAALPSFAALFENQEDCDVFFQVDDQLIGAHKAFVQARSVVLYEAIKKKTEQHFKETALQEVSEKLNQSSHLTVHQKPSQHWQPAAQKELTEQRNAFDQQEQTIPSEEKSVQLSCFKFCQTEPYEQSEIKTLLQQEQRTIVEQPVVGSFETEQHQLLELQNNNSNKKTQEQKAILIPDVKFEVFKIILR